MNQNNWIEELIESSSQLQDVEHSPYLYQRIEQQLKNELSVSSNRNLTMIKWSVAATILILLNVSVIIFKNKSKHPFHDGYSTVHSISNSFNNSTTYNY